jgi:hypothetical protein
MKIFLLILGFGLLFIGPGCNSEGSNDNQSETLLLEKEVLAIHDEVMPRMSEIEELRSALKDEAMNASLDSTYLQAIHESMKALEAGDSLMWDWMHNYNKPENLSVDSLKVYLTAEKEKIAGVSTSMKNAIADAQGLLQKLGHREPH